MALSFLIKSPCLCRVPRCRRRLAGGPALRSWHTRAQTLGVGRQRPAGAQRCHGKMEKMGKFSYLIYLIYLSINLSVCLSICLPLPLSLSLSLSLSISIYKDDSSPSIKTLLRFKIIEDRLRYLEIWLINRIVHYQPFWGYPHVWKPIYLSVCLSIYLSI